ncbi:hypothetical protein M8J77_007346 [Diaphorina citri]|nr:hypothetical protein M8J77_007346 [Diaphorina citri]
MRPVTLLWLSLHLLAQFGHSRRDKVNENLAWFWRLPDTDLPRSEQFNYVPRFLRISEESEHRFRTTFLHHVFGLTSNNKKRLWEAKQAKKVQPHYEGPFPCDLSQARSPLPPNNVNQLRPGDIDIVGAIGDSITAGNGIVATNPSQVNTENRGLSWSVGGQEDWRTYLTVPNILKMFNPNLFGYSLSDSYSTHRNAQFNVAEIGAMSKDLVSMAKEVSKRIKNDPRTDLKNHWKLITIMMGSNDFCSDLCYSEVDKALERHREDLVTALSILQRELPRTLVNLVIQPNLHVLTSGQYPIQCNLLHLFLCPCLFASKYKSLQDDYEQLMRSWQVVEMEVSKMPQFRTKDFAVVPQMFTMDIKLPTLKSSRQVDMNHMAPDCFHLSQRSHSLAANALWNNMLEPTHNKSTNWTPAYQLIRCPSESSPYLFTWDNS